MMGLQCRPDVLNSSRMVLIVSAGVCVDYHRPFIEIFLYRELLVSFHPYLI